MCCGNNGIFNTVNGACCELEMCARAWFVPQLLYHWDTPVSERFTVLTYITNREGRTAVNNEA